MGENKGRVWVVDDAPDITVLMEHVLTRSGFTVQLFPDGVSALEAAKSDQPDLILLDIRMPGMDGFQVCETLKASPSTEEIPVVFLSAKGDTSDVVRGLRMGAVDYVIKPCAEEEILARVSTHVALARTRRQLKATNAELEEALDRIHQMAPLIPVCSSCRKIRDDEGYWTSLEEYLQESTGSLVTHGICEDCVRKLYPDLAD